MNKKAIWLSVGIMGIALLGILILQFYWISWSVRLNEKQFDDSAIAALKRVSDMLQKEKENWDIDQLDQILFEGSAERNFLFNMVDLTDEMMKNNFQNSQDSIVLNGMKHPLDSWDMKRKLAEMYDRQIRIHPVSLDQRINPTKLSDLLKHEFQELHVDLNYNFGVYDNSMKSFVILNGNYLVNLGDGKLPNLKWNLKKAARKLLIL